jgi:hypothetical protein
LTSQVEEPVKKHKPAPSKAVKKNSGAKLKANEKKGDVQKAPKTKKEKRKEKEAERDKRKAKIKGDETEDESMDLLKLNEMPDSDDAISKKKKKKKGRRAKKLDSDDEVDINLSQ